MDFCPSRGNDVLSSWGFGKQWDLAAAFVIMGTAGRFAACQEVGVVVQGD